MLDCAKAVLLGVVQGLTEFLPVSSSGHLVLAKRLLGLHTPGATLEVALHAGTLLSVLLYYRRRLGTLLLGILHGERAACGYGVVLLVASIPALLVGGLFHRRLDVLFDRPAVSSAMLMITGVVLLSLRHVRVAGRDAVSMGKGFWVGVAQAAAILPGISRSGLTVVAARHMGVDPRHAVEFSLLLSVPVLLGAMVVTAVRGAGTGLGDLSALPLLAGTGVAAVVGLGAIYVLVRALVSGRFWWFGFYCLGVGALGLGVG